MFLGGGGQGGFSSRPFAEATQATIDAEVARLLREAEQSAVALIGAHRSELDDLVSLLLETETVDGAEVYRIVGKPVPTGHTDELTIVPHGASSVGQASAAGAAASGIGGQQSGAGGQQSGAGGQQSGTGGQQTGAAS